MRLPRLSLRALFLLGFAIGMPLLALPPVARRIDTLLYGPAPAEFSRPPNARPLQQVIEPQVVERVSPASFDEIIPDEGAPNRLPHEGLDAIASEPPPLAPPTAFALPTGQPQMLDRVATATAKPLFDQASALRLTEIRGELEKLGADYMLLETIDGSGYYRFRCDLKLDEKSSFARQFEAAADSPQAAAEEVLRQVSQWRTAGRPAGESLK